MCVCVCVCVCTHMHVLYANPYVLQLTGIEKGSKVITKIIIGKCDIECGIVRMGTDYQGS